MRITTCSVPIVERKKKKRRGKEKREKEEEEEYSPSRNIEENSRTISVRFHASSVNISENIVAMARQMRREEDLAMCTYIN